MVLAMTVLFSCDNTLKDVQSLDILDSGPLTIAEQIHSKYTDSGALKMILISPKMYNYTNRRFPFYEFPDGIDLTLFDDDNQTSRVLADYAIMYDETDLIDLRGNVVLTNPEKDTLFAEQLYYDQAKEWMFTNRPVQFKTAEQLINGTGFDSNRDFSNATVLEITGYVMLDE